MIIWIKNIHSFTISKFSELVLYIFIVTIFSIPRGLEEIKILFILILISSFIIFKKYIISSILPLLKYCLLFFSPVKVGLQRINKLNYMFKIVRINFSLPLLLLLILQRYSLKQLIKIFKFSTILSIFIIFINFLSSVLKAFKLFSFKFNYFFYPKEEFFAIHDGYLHIINSSL